MGVSAIVTQSDSGEDGFKRLRYHYYESKFVGMI